MRRTIITLILFVAVAGGPHETMAQPAAGSAEQLFRDGKRLIGEGNITAACEAFEGSFRMSPVASTLMNLADCREKNHQYGSAWGHFVEAARLTATDPALAVLHKSATDRANKVELRLSYLIINVPDEARVEGLTITRNGTAVDPAEWNRDIPVVKLRARQAVSEPPSRGDLDSRRETFVISVSALFDGAPGTMFEEPGAARFRAGVRWALDCSPAVRAVRSSREVRRW